MTSDPQPTVTVPMQAWRGAGPMDGERAIPEEAAVALTYDSNTHAVMMATPADLEDFAVGFSLTEGIISQADQIESLQILPQEEGIELRMRIATAETDAFYRRRRHLAGVTGCGLCGIESLAEAMRPTPVVAASGLPVWLPVSGRIVAAAMAELAPHQPLNRQTRAVHAAAFWHRTRGLVAVREDVGRHNALDKLAGALARAGIPPAEGIVLLTSRVSVEMVQKTAMMGAPVIAAVSAPTALAVRTAAAAGITLIAVARDDGFEIFTHRERIRDVA